jgi:SAM-dependent methyltransferase
MDNKSARLQERVRVEAEYHNSASERTGQDLIYGLPVPPVIQKYTDGLLADIYGKTVIDIGCGAGGNLLRLAAKGAHVWGIDISQQAVSRCSQLISGSPFASRITVSVGDAHKMKFPDGFADIIVGNSVLHHLELEVACSELYRCLKTGGRAVFAEPLGHNPFLNLFRKLTPHRRTPTERPLRWSDIELLSRMFRVSHKEFFCLPIVAFVPGILGMRRVFRWSFNSLYQIERALKADRLLRKYSWITVLELHKNNENK